MSWTDSMVKVSLATLALAAAGSATAATLVVRSNGPSAGLYPPGKALPDGGSIMLKAGDTVTVLDAKGTRVLNGPGSVAVAGTGAASASSLTALLANNGARQSRTGATRGVNSGPAHATNVWYVDGSRSGMVCVVDPMTVALWRPSADMAGAMKLTRLSDGKMATVDFREGQAVHPWPVADLPVTEGGRYRIEGAGLMGPTTITTTVVHGAPNGLDGTAQALMAKNCTVQMDLLVAATMPDAGG